LEKTSLTIRYEDSSLWIVATIASSKNANLLSFAGNCPGDPFHQRRLTSSSRGDIADADYRSFKFGCFEGSALVESVARANDRSVQVIQWRQD
jgi:hypothetical protein